VQKINHVYSILSLILLFFLSGQVHGDTLDRQRHDFLQAEKFIAQNDESAYLDISTSLKDYPLFPYLQYQWLKDHLEQTSKIMQFLAIHGDTRYAGLLRSRWLNYLSKHERWLDFLQHYQASDSIALRCQYYWASYKTGHQYEALNEAKNLWLTGDSQPEECQSLLSALVISPLLTDELIWQRFELALKKDNVYLAEYVQRFMNESDRSIASFWLQVHKKPALIIDGSFRSKQNKFQGRIFAHGIDRMAKDDPDWAILLWDSGKNNFNIEESVAHKLERRLGIALGLKKDRRAYSRLAQLPGIDAELREWKVRSALLEQNWQHVASALAGLTQEEQRQPQWQYWQARALVASGGSALAAKDIYDKVAEDRSLYGILAANAADKAYRVIDKPVIATEDELDALSREKEFKAAKELDLLNRNMEAQRQWWFAIKKLSKLKRMTAAKLAQKWHWVQIAIMTLVKADYWDDLSLRFPLSYLDHVQDNAYRQNLDPAILLGLMRQESMLNENAMSAVGARGLMQIMPKTGRQIALELNEKWQSESNLFNPDVNVRYGAHYYRQLLNRYHGHIALATAAYNAGPGRVDNWLPQDRPLSADIWIETIPFKETRKYVTSVLSYTMIYQNLIHSNILKVKNLLPDIPPG